MLSLRVRPFCLPKEGNRPEEYEDAWAWDGASRRLAVADGASDAFESRVFARALVERFVREPPAPDAESVLAWLVPPALAWREQIRWDRLPYYAAEKARRGSFATLLGLTFSPPGSDPDDAGGTVARWQAVAVGDACLFQVRGGEAIACFPMERSADFGTTPPLLSTLPAYSRRSLEELRTREGECRAGDLLVLATDALAAWFLREMEGGRQPWESLVGLNRPRFGRLVARLRRRASLRNDDVTLLLAWVEDSAATPAAV